MKTNAAVVLAVTAVALVLAVPAAFAYGGMMTQGLGQSSGFPSGMMGGSQGFRTSMGGMMGGFGEMISSGGTAVSGMMTAGMPCLQYGNLTASSGTWHMGTNMVAIMNYAFYPTSLTVAKGTTVTWVNMDFVQHTVTSGSEAAPTGLFDSHELSHMQAFSYTFNTPGTYAYYCDLHANMAGTITVTG